MSINNNNANYKDSNIDVSSTSPNDLHLVLEPRTRSMVAQRIAKESLALTQLIRAPYDFPHYTTRCSARHFKKNSASMPSTSSTLKQVG